MAKFKRLGALVMALVMCASMICVPVSAKTVFDNGNIWFGDDVKVNITAGAEGYTFMSLFRQPVHGYEFSGHSSGGELAQTFVVVDTVAHDGTVWTPDGVYDHAGNNNYEVTYCADVENSMVDSTYYKRVNLEEGGYYDADQAAKLRAILLNSYPYVSLEAMKASLAEAGVENADQLTRGEIIAAVQSAIWVVANGKDAEDFAYAGSVRMTDNYQWGYPMHDTSAESGLDVAGKRKIKQYPEVGARVDALTEYLAGMDGVAASAEQTVITELKMTGKATAKNDGSVNVLLDLTLNSSGSSDKDDVKIVLYVGDKEAATVAVRNGTEKYTAEVIANRNDKITAVVSGIQNLPAGAYFYVPKAADTNGDGEATTREVSQNMVGVSGGATPVYAKAELDLSEIKVPPTPPIDPTPGYEEDPVNKTAKPLDEKDQTEVTLSVPATAEDYSSDIVMIIGRGPSSDYEYLTQTIKKMLVAADGTATKIKLGLVTFADTTEEEIVLPLTEMRETDPNNQAKDDMDYIIAQACQKTYTNYSGINLESALITARDMLAADTDIPANRKHMIVVSTGLTYYYDNDAGQASTILGSNGYGNYMHGNKYWLKARNNTTNTSNGYKIPTWAEVKVNGAVDYKASWENYWNMIVGWVAADQNTYEYDLNGQTYKEFLTDENGTLYGKNYVEIKPNNNNNLRYGYAMTDADDIAAVKAAVPYFAAAANPATTANAGHALNYERAQYEAWVVYNQMQTPIGESFTTALGKTVKGLGFNCYAIANGVSSNPGEEDRWLQSNQIGYNFMRMLGGENCVNWRDHNDFFAPIENEILYHCSIGSTVEDYIGYDEKKGDFEFITDADTIVMKKGDTVYTTTKLETPNEGADASYTFTAPGAEEPTFSMDYYYGNGKTTERFVWTFGENVSRFVPVSLTYKLQLTKKCQEDGEYVIDTNLSATLYPVNSKGEEGDPVEFPVPNVKYTVQGYAGVDIVLGLGAGIAQYNDGSDKGSNTYDSIVTLVEPLIEKGIEVKLGLVAVEHYTERAMELTVLTADNYKSVIKNGLADIVKMPAGPTNLEAVITAAHDMLDGDTSVPYTNKFFHVIATGRTYCFDDFNDDPATIINQVALKGKTEYYWGHYLWQSQRGRNTSLYLIPNSDWGTYWNNVQSWVAADGDKYVYSFPAADDTDPDWFNTYYNANNKDAKALGLASSRFGWIFQNPAVTAEQFKTTGEIAAIGSGANPDNALNYERAQYDSWKAFEAIKAAGYTCYALCSESTAYQNYSPYMTIKGVDKGLQLGHAFMNYLASGNPEEGATLLFVMTDETTGASEMAENFFAPIDIQKLAKANDNVPGTISGKTRKPARIPMFSTGPKVPALSILTQPVDAEGALGETVSVFVEAAGQDLKYQWYFRDGDGEFSKSSIKSDLYEVEMTKARAGRELYCVITDANGNTVTTDTVKLIRVAAEELAIITQPVDAEGALGETVTVSVEAKGEGLKYQWYFKDAGSEKVYTSSIKTNVYETEMTKARAGRELYCVITDALGNKVQTDTVKLIRTISETLEIVTQPVNTKAALGETVSVHVEAKGEGLKYQWYFRDAGAENFSKSSIKSDLYTAEMTKARAGRELYCVITDALGNKVQTDTVKLILGVNEELGIVTQPVDAEGAIGDTVSVFVEAKGDGLKYQWYFKDAGSRKFVASSINSDTYEVELTAKRVDRELYCVVTDAMGKTVTTETVKLLLVEEAPVEIIEEPAEIIEEPVEEVIETPEA